MNVCPLRSVRSRESGGAACRLGLLLFFLALLGTSQAVLAQTDEFQPDREAGAGTLLVHSRFGGQIFGFDIDQHGSEGVLTEAKTLNNGTTLAAVETFDQATGAILRVVTQTMTHDDFLGMGVVGNSIGLIQHEHSNGNFITSRTFKVMNPLSGNQFSGRWSPPIGSQHIIMPAGVSRSQGTPHVAVFAYDNSGNFIPYVFRSNVAANTFGPIIRITDSLNFGSVPPPIVYDNLTNQAILGGGQGCFGCSPVLGFVNLTTGQFSPQHGAGFGFINGMAVDPVDGILVTTTEDDAAVEFYNLATHGNFKVQLPGSGGQQFFSGADVAFDAAHKLFLVAQPNSSQVSNSSTIYVYDRMGNLMETLNGFHFSNTFNVVPMHIALNPVKRSGFVDGPDDGVTELQSFTY